MSKNIVIQEGGLGKQMTANKLKTNLVGGGACLWVPEDETTLGTKVITENGTYKASDDGYYGYSQVTVNGVGSVTGKDGDGDDAEATVDPGTGEIVIKKLPSSIQIVTPPMVTEYSDGATIDFSGIVVKAYLRSGGIWTDSSHPDGIIPINELVFPITIADADDVSGKSASSDIIDGSIPMASGDLDIIWNVTQGVKSWKTMHSGATVTAKKDDSWIRYLAVSTSHVTEIESQIISWKEVYPEYKDIVDPSQTETRSYSHELKNTYTYDGRTAYYVGFSGSYPGEIQNMPPEYNIPLDGKAAWTILYGTVSGGVQNIPVQWTRSGSSETFEDSFGITVNASMGGATGGGGQAGETGAGRND